MNVVILMGRLVKDPEERQTKSGAHVSRYTLAVDRQKKDGEEQSADFIGCIAFGAPADFANKYLKKGVKVNVVGRLQTGSYTDKDGKKVYTSDVIVERHYFCESKKEESAATLESGFMSFPDDVADEGLPFN